MPDQAVQQAHSFRPIPQSAIGVDVPLGADYFAAAAPGLGRADREPDGSVGIVRARYYQAGKGKGHHRDGSEPGGRCWKGRTGWIGRRGQESGANAALRSRLGHLAPMRNEQACHAMRDQDDVAGIIGYGPRKGANPFADVRMLPIPLLHASERGVELFPQGLPMVGPGGSESRKYEKTHAMTRVMRKGPPRKGG